MIEVRDPKRVATASIRGYLYQFLCTARTWFELRPNEVLWCEGNEDIDRLISSGEVIEEQVKHIGGSVAASSAILKKSAINFLKGYVAHHVAGRQARFVFRTTADLSSFGTSGVDLWLRGLPSNASADLLIQELVDWDGSASAQDALGHLRANSLCDLFLDACKWHFGECDYQGVRNQLMAHVMQDSRLGGADPQTVVDAVLARIAHASSAHQLSDRSLNAADLDILICDTLVARCIQRHAFRWDDDSAVFLAFFEDPEGLACAVALRAEHACLLRDATNAICDGVFTHPGFNGQHCAADALTFYSAWDELAKLDFDLYVTWGRVPTSKRRVVRRRWLLMRVLRMARWRAESGQVYFADEQTRSLIYPMLVPIDACVAPHSDPIVALGAAISTWIIAEANGQNVQALTGLRRKFRCVCKWDRQEFFTQDDPPERWFSGVD